MLQLQHKSYHWINSPGFIVCVLTYHEDIVQELTHMGNLSSDLGMCVLVFLAITINCLILYWHVCDVAGRSIPVWKGSDCCQKLLECGTHMHVPSGNPSGSFTVALWASSKGSKFTSLSFLLLLQGLNELWTCRRACVIQGWEQNRLGVRVVWSPELLPSCVTYLL